MQMTTGLAFERVRHNLASAAWLMADVIIDQCEATCVCTDSTVIRDSIPKSGRCVGENVSKKEARGTECGAAPYLPVDATGKGAIFQQDSTIGSGHNRAANLKYVDAWSVECQITCGTNPSRRSELVRARCECLARQINTRQVHSERYTLAIAVRRGAVSYRLDSGSIVEIYGTRGHTRREASQSRSRIEGYLATDDGDAGVGHPGASDHGVLGSSLHIRANVGVSCSKSQAQQDTGDCRELHFV